MGDIHTGRCNCGGVTIEAIGPLKPAIACHCSQCRRQTGLYYAATNIDLDRLRLSGEENITWYRASDAASRGFCRTCGSALFWRADDSDYLSVMAGVLDQPSGLSIGYHIFCDDKGDFYEIADGRPCFGQGRPDGITDEEAAAS